MIVASLSLALVSAPVVPGGTDPHVYRYRVRNGDTLTRLAVDYLKGPDALRVVLKANAIRTPRELRTDEVLQIPYRIMRRVRVDGTLIAFRGLVQVGGKGAAVGLPVAEGTSIATGANASTSIRFPDGTLVSIPSNSRVRVLRLSRYVLSGEVDRDFIVDEGGSEWQVTPARLPGDRLRVRTPVAVSAVRGTEFRVTYRLDSKLSGSSVTRGEVGFSAGATPVALPQGFGAAVDPARKIDKRALLVAPELEPGFAQQIDTEARFALVPVSGAKAYLATVARDAAFVDVVAAIRSNTPRLTFSGLQDGPYFVRVSAIDAVDLEGFSRDARFTRKFGPLQAGNAYALNGQMRFPWVSAMRERGKFRFTLSKSADLSKPILDVLDGSQDGVTVAGLPKGNYFWQVSVDPRPGIAAPPIVSGVQSIRVGRR